MTFLYDSSNEKRVTDNNMRTRCSTMDRVDLTEDFKLNSRGHNRIRFCQILSFFDENVYFENIKIV